MNVPARLSCSFLAQCEDEFRSFENILRSQFIIRSIRIDSRNHPQITFVIDFKRKAEISGPTRTILLFLGGASLLIAGIIWLFLQLSREQIDLYSTTFANVFLFLVIIGFIVSGMRKRINVYDAFVEGAKEGFSTAVRIIPYLVAILVSIGVFRASGAMDFLIQGIAGVVRSCGIDDQFVGALPTALMKPLSGSGARGLMVDAMSTYGADSFVGRLACIFQGSTDTTFYILAVYFGSVSVTRTRHALSCGLIADFTGILAAIFIGYLFFN